MRILVAGTMAERRGTLIMTITKMAWHLADGAVFDHRPGVPNTKCRTVAFRRGRQMDHCLGQVELAFWKPDVLDCVGSSDCNDQGLGVGHADVFAGQDDQSAGDEPGVFSGFQHARQPIQPGISVTPTDAFDEGADHVVVIVSAVA